MPDKAQVEAAQNETNAKNTHVNTKGTKLVVSGAKKAENKVKAYMISFGLNICNISPCVNPSGFTLFSVNV